MHGAQHHNPWKKEPYIPGGSSSGSSVAVAAGLVPFALGTDTGGSIRVPAALCGIVGLSPTAGRVDREGMWPLTPSLDSIGPLARSMQDIVIVYTALQNMTIKSSAGIKGLHIGVCETVFFDDVQEEVEKAVLLSAKLLEKLGANICSVKLSEIESLHNLACETSLIAAEGYPLHKEIVDNLDSDWVVHWLKVAREYSNQRVAIAQKKKTELEVKLASRMKDLDALLVPTTPLVALPVSTCDTPDSHAAMSALMSRNTNIGNLAGWCGLSVPCGLTHDGLPIGLMIYAGAHNELIAIEIAHAFESVFSSVEMGTLEPPYSFSVTH